MGTATAQGPAKGGTGRVTPAGGIAYWMSGALAVAAAVSSLLTYLVGDVLRGPAVMNGSARGTALVVLVVGVPVLACSLVLAWRGSVIAVVTWLAAIGFLLYNALMFVFATPVNRLFPLYLTMLSLAAWSAGTLLWQTNLRALGRLIPARGPARLAPAGAAWLTLRAGFGQSPDAGDDAIRFIFGDRDHVIGEVTALIGVEQRTASPLQIGTEGLVPFSVVVLDPAKDTAWFFLAAEVVDDRVVASLFCHRVSPVGSPRTPLPPAGSESWR
jgi:hypothetical protein